MIRINLIPVPKARKQERLIIESIFAAIFIAGTVVACFIYGSTKEKAVSDAKVINQQIQSQINELKAKVGEVEKFKLKLKTLQDQLKVIQDLEAKRSGPVRMMDELTDLVPRKLWIESFKEQNGKLTIQGYAQDGPIIADFLESIKKSKHFSNAQLQVINSQEQNQTETQKFTIQLDVRYEM